MFNLTEILQKELHDGNENKGVIEVLLFDNFTRSCLLQTQQGIFVVDKISPRWDGVKAVTHVWQNEQITKLTDKKQFVHSMEIKQKIINQNGMAMGEVDDVELTAKLAIKRLLTTDGKYLSRGEVIAVGDVVIAKAKQAKKAVLDELRREKVLEKLIESSANTNREDCKEDGEKYGETTEAQPKEDGDNESDTKGDVKERADAAGELPAELTEEKNETTAQPGAEKQNGMESKNKLTHTEQSAQRTGTKEQGMRIAFVGDKTIRRKYGDFSFLIGKSVDKTVVNFQGEVMIRQHETITRDILRQAKISGKLLELYLHIE